MKSNLLRVERADVTIYIAVICGAWLILAK